MDTRAEESVEAVSLPPEALPFRMCVVYDSEAACEAADEASEFVLKELGEDIAVEKMNWEAALFGLNAARRQAAIEAADADIILVVLSSDNPARQLKQWTAEWLHLRRDQGGLLAVIPSGSNGDEHAEMIQYFHETAVSAGMDFLCRKHRVL